MFKTCPMLPAMLLLVMVCTGPTKADDHTASGYAGDDGFVDLYNGEDLTGWRTTGNWVPQDGGILKIDPRPGERGWQRFEAYLTTQRTYADFILELEFKLERGGNSGVHFRIGDPAEPVTRGIEVQILDSFGKPDERLTHHDNGGVIRTSPPSKNMSKPAGEWNQLVITCKGHHLTVVLNGERVQDLQLDEGAMKDRPLEGHIALQDHGIPMWFRNIRIKELD
ncbi:MAG: DUF1080 domain-containing protein [Planctomycetota bacterium]